MRFVKLGLVALLIPALTGCGYRLAARKGDAGAGQTFAVPTFVNSTNPGTYRIEQRLSEAVRRELARRTHYKVTAAGSGDVVLTGEVLSYGTSPTIFDDRGRATQYALGLTMKVRVVETATGKVLFENVAMPFRETFQLSQNASDFVPEDPAAVDRLAGSFASSIVAAVVHRNEVQ